MQDKGVPLNFGDYRTYEKLSENALEQTFRADHQTLQLPVVLRRWNADRLAEFEDVSAYIHRVQTATAVHHPHLLAALDAGIHDGVPYTASEFVESADLASFVTRMGAMPVSLACEYIRQAAAGLQSAHESGLYHGWLSPASLLLAPIIRKTRADGSISTRPSPVAKVKITDVGQLPNRPTIHDRPFTADAEMGPVEFFAPERIGTPGYDERTDVYGLGACLYHLIAGKPPYEGSSPIDTLLKIQQQEPIRLDSLRNDIEADIVELVSRMLAKIPESRPTLAEVTQILLPYCEAIPEEAATGAVEEAPSHAYDPFGESLDSDAEGDYTSTPRFVSPVKEGIKPMTWIMIGSACWLVAILGWVLMSFDIFKSTPKIDPNAPPPIKHAKPK